MLANQGGKVYHPGHPPNNDMPLSWDTYFKANGDDSGCRANETIYSNVCPSAQPDSAFYDNILANATVQQFAVAKATGKPFFIAAGLRRPHRNQTLAQRGVPETAGARLL